MGVAGGRPGFPTESWSSSAGGTLNNLHLQPGSDECSRPSNERAEKQRGLLKWWTGGGMVERWHLPDDEVPPDSAPPPPVSNLDRLDLDAPSTRRALSGSIKPSGA